jgi:hypothetical protein
MLISHIIIVEILRKYYQNAAKMFMLCSNIIMLMCIVGEHMDIHKYSNLRRIWICSHVHAHGYSRGRGRVRPMDLGMDLILLYPSKTTSLLSLTWVWI